MGDRAILVQTESLDDVLALHGRLEASRPAGVIDLVPAARTVLVRVDPAVLSLEAARAWVVRAGADAASTPARDTRVVDLEVTYDGADLDDTAALLGMTPDGLVRRHSSAAWTVAFTGFAPGFGYLVSPDWNVDVPRLEAPRTRVPRGAVGLAAGFTGAYPRETPGGWRLIGTTDAVLFDPVAERPALLAPGTRVRFRAVVRRDPSPPSVRSPDLARNETTDAAALRVLEPGLLATVQDLGRPGSAALGVAPSGALDRGALRLANRLLGNAEGAAAIEVTMGGFRAVAAGDLWFAVTGAWGSITVDGATVDPFEAHLWPADAELALDWFDHGTRAYLAVRGGIDALRALGSRSTDVMAGLGPDRLRTGDALAVGADTVGEIPAAGVAPWGAPHDDEIVVELAPGPRADWFAASAHALLFESIWTVTNDTDRIGMRLDGPELARVRDGELPSEGMVAGALQVPPSGRPTILLADCPVTGGYPVIAVATDASLDLLAQTRPGTRIRFRHARSA
ncbi:urea amidolyase family protein [Microbacterium lacus]